MNGLITEILLKLLKDSFVFQLVGVHSILLHNYPLVCVTEEELKNLGLFNVLAKILSVGMRLS